MGRAFLRVISGRQCGNHSETKLGPALVAALRSWKALLNVARRRTLRPPENDDTEWVIFTDGYTPDQRKGESGCSMIGGVLFAADGSVAPRYFSEVVPPALIADWQRRSTQIYMIEILAVVMAWRTWGHLLFERRVLVFVDSESAEGALTKGYSSKEDACMIVSDFWVAVARDRALVYLDRVPTDANPADDPSRPGKCRGLEAHGWVRDRSAIWPWSSKVYSGLGL